MTCIVGLEHAGAAWMGWDSCVSSDDGGEYAAAHDKVVTVGPMLIGFAGDLAAATVAAYAVRPPADSVGDVREYLATELVPVIRRVLKDSDVDGGLDMLIALSGEVWFGNSDGVVYRPRCGYGAIGSGAHCAIGALYALECIEPRQRVSIALEAAGHLCSGVGPPYRIVRGGQVG